MSESTLTLEVSLTVNGWGWTIRENGVIIDAGIEYSEDEARAMGSYFLAKYRRLSSSGVSVVPF